MATSSQEQETKKVLVTVEKDPVATSFDKWGATRRLVIRLTFFWENITL